MKTTKPEILDAALTVFSHNGYEGTKLVDIADMLGITKGALYKHYESKEVIWEAMLDRLEGYYHEHMGAIPEKPVPASADELKQLSLRQIGFTLHDETIKRIRKILTAEQYRNERIKALAIKHFLVDMESLYTRIFAGMIEGGSVIKADAKMLAFEYTAPITGLIHRCDLEPEREDEIMEKIIKHIDLFCAAYCKKAGHGELKQ